MKVMEKFEVGQRVLVSLHNGSEFIDKVVSIGKLHIKLEMSKAKYSLLGQSFCFSFGCLLLVVLSGYRKNG